MFKSTQRPIVIPQSEHLKLAGALAQLWGNAEFELPPLPRLSVVAGIRCTTVCLATWTTSPWGRKWTTRPGCQ